MTETASVLSERLLACKALGFDFDGTLVDSNQIKRGAFDVCFAEYPDYHTEIHDYCSRFNHTPRWEKFQHVVEVILEKPYTEEIAKSLHQRYEAATTKQVIAAPEIPGAMDFLRKLLDVDILLLSSTPDAILRDILNQRQMSGFFDMIQGAPLDKAAHLSDYKKTHGLKDQDVLYFGDTPEDAAAARKAQWPFVAVANPALQPTADFYLEDFRALGTVSL